VFSRGAARRSRRSVAGREEKLISHEGVRPCKGGQPAGGANCPATDGTRRDDFALSTPASTRGAPVPWRRKVPPGRIGGQRGRTKETSCENAKAETHQDHVVVERARPKSSAGILGQAPGRAWRPAQGSPRGDSCSRSAWRAGRPAGRRPKALVERAGRRQMIAGSTVARRPSNGEGDALIWTQSPEGLQWSVFCCPSPYEAFTDQPRGDSRLQGAPASIIQHAWYAPAGGPKGTGGAQLFLRR